MKEKSSFANRLLALVIFLLVIGGYLEFYLIPELSQGGEITPFQNPKQKVDPSKSCSKFVNGLKETGIGYSLYSIYGSPLVLKNIENPKGTIYLAIDIQRDYRDSEVKALKDFNRQGGSVIIADHGTRGDSIVYFSPFDGVPILKLNTDGSSGDLVLANSTSARPFYSREYLLQMHRPVALQRGVTDDLGQVLSAWTSEKVFHDSNDNTQFDPGESTDNAVVYDLEHIGSHGEGFIAAIGDPDIFTDKYIDLGGNATKGNNKEFLIDLIRTLLPGGGKILFDESRHVGTPFTGLGQGTFEAMVLLTSNWNEVLLMLVGLTMVIVGIIARTKGKEEWAHKHNPNRRALRPYLPETDRDAAVLLRDVLLKKVRMKNNLSEAELDEMPHDDLLGLIHDKELSCLFSPKRQDLSKAEINRLMKRIERWE